MKNYLPLLFIISCTLACSSKYTASFNKSTPFHTSQVKANQSSSESKIKEKTPELTKGEKPADELVASVRTNIAQKFPEVEAIVEKYQKRKETISVSGLDKKKRKKALRQEQVLARKELKRELKELKAEVEQVKKISSEKEMSPDKKIYVGLIVAAAGLIVAILASGSVGGLAIIIGVGLIAWGLIEQGNL